MAVDETNSDNQKFIVVIGASAGGLHALEELVSQFKPDIKASFFIVLHLSRKGIGDFLIHRLQQRTPMPCAIPIDGEPIQEGHIYIAPPNQHLLVTKKGITIGHGPAENRWRPSIDVLFRSAAAAYNGHTIGIILTGLLDDGTSGMGAIKRCGGTCIVQDPNEAEYPDMPLSVLNNIEVDYCVSLIQMGTVLDSITTNTNIEITEIPPDVKAESEIARKVATGPDKVTPLGEHTLYSCPDCGGGLWHVDADNINRYRCHIGHSYSEKDLMIKQADVLESTLWVALRMMEERKRLLVKLEGDSMQRGFARIATGHRTAADELQVHVDKLKELLFSVQETDHT